MSISKSIPRTNTALCSPRPSLSKSQAQDPRSPVLTTTPLPPLPADHILLKIHHFGFSANNVTYQALGEHPHFRYFEYHHTPESVDKTVSHKTHGFIPVWGFATVLASTHAKILAGERVYGYFAPAQYLSLPISPNDVNKHAFYVPRPHLPTDRRPYNQILRCESDPHYRPEYEELTMLYRPLFWTSYWFEDYLHASVPAYSSPSSATLTILISSASSKTAFCLAYLINQRLSKNNPKTNHVRVVGLTSSKNVEFTKNLGLYTTGVHAYTDDLERILFEMRGGGKGKWIYVDVAGNEQLNSRLGKCFASGRCGEVVKAVTLGMTNLSPASSGDGQEKEWKENTFSTNSPPSTVGSEKFNFEDFFMPEWLAVRRTQLTPPEIFERQNVAWHALMRDCKSWVELENVRGAGDVKHAYEKLIRDGVGPEKGLVWSMFGENDDEAEVERGRVISRL